MLAIQLYPLIGSGYLRLNDGTSARVHFNLIINAVNMTGGGGIYGEEKFIQHAARADGVRLSVSPDKSFFLIFGIPSEGGVSVSVLGPAAEGSHSAQAESE